MVNSEYVHKNQKKLIMDLEFFHLLHASGHLNRYQIGQVVTEIDAKKVFPVHTENAALFKKIGKKVHLSEYALSSRILAQCRKSTMLSCFIFAISRLPSN